MSPKTLTGEELQLDDAPARDAELFLVDGNNLAYRAFFALPEELATSEGFATNALLGFTNMLFKLLTDYRPKGVAVAWDTRPVHRAELSETYKSERRPMPDLLREQFPFFRPIVEALRLPQPRVRGLGGGRRDRDARDPRRRGRGEDVRGLDRPRRLPARQRQRHADDDPARRRGRQRLHPRARRGPARDHRRQGAGLHRPEGRHLRQHRRRPRHRRQDRLAADPEVRLARRRARARRRADACAAQGAGRARRPGAQLEGARDDAPRPRHRLRPGRARARTARPLAADRDVPPLRVPRPPAASRPARRGSPRRRPARGRGRRAALAGGLCPYRRLVSRVRGRRRSGRGRDRERRS